MQVEGLAFASLAYILLVSSHIIINVMTSSPGCMGASFFGHFGHSRSSFHALVLIVGILLISSDQFAFRIPSIICTLHSRPDPSAIAKQLTEPDSDGRGNRLALVENIIEMLARDPKQGGDLAPGLARRRDHILAQQFAWVSRAPVPVALG